MSLATFQLGALLVLAIAYAFSIARAPCPRRRAAEVLLLALAGVMGEQSCISLYGFYEYAPGWLGRVGDVPPLVPLIWPLVILSAREVRDALRRPEGDAPCSETLAGALRGALVVAALVTIDASLMEVLSVAAGYWRWVEPGYMGVPLIGILGWGCFAFGAALALDLSEERERALWLLPPLALASTHAGLLALWWGALRWVLRGDVGAAAPSLGLASPGFAPLCVAPIALAALAAVVLARRRGAPGLDLGTTAPRVVASALFFALLGSLGGPLERPALWAHTALVALPYLAAVRWRGR